MLGEWRNILFFPMICGSGGSKSRLAKEAGAETPAQMSNGCGAKHILKSKCTKHTMLGLGPLLEIRMWKNCTWRQAQFANQNVQNTPASDHFLKSGCWKMAHRCGAKHIYKSKC